jgi:hypothetical protein
VVHPLVLRSAEPQEPYPLPCLNLITLITYQFSLLLFVCLACLCLWLASLTYPSPTPPYCTVVGLSTINNLITLITYLSVFLLILTLRLSCLPLGLPVPAYPSHHHHHLPCTGVGLSISTLPYLGVGVGLSTVLFAVSPNKFRPQVGFETGP